MSSSAPDPTLIYLAQLSCERFYGSITLKFEQGRIVHLRKEENLKPSELSGIPKENNAPTSLTRPAR